jgi:hypothetical protein
LLAVPHSQRDRQLISARHLTAAKISDVQANRYMRKKQKSSADHQDQQQEKVPIGPATVPGLNPAAKRASQ